MTYQLVLLDRVGDVNPPDGYVLIDTEVAFLRYAPSGQPLFVRGDRLCDWAQVFFEARGLPTRETDSLTRALRMAVPALTEGLARELASQFTPRQLEDIPRPLTPRRIMEALYPCRLWRGSPSREHAAEWLLWLYTEHPTSAIQTVLNIIQTEWRNTAEGPEAEFYSADDADVAHELLRGWLWIVPHPAMQRVAGFPASVPPDLVKEARRQWAMDLIETEGKLFDDLLHRSLPTSLRQAAAVEAIKYARAYPQFLSQERFVALSSFMSPSEQEELSQYLHPVPPDELPEGVEDVLTWFETSYLPYRQWQRQHGSNEDAALAHGRAREFAEWYISRYPSGLLAGDLLNHLSFRQTLEHHLTSTMTTLVVVLDGLHAQDARQLRSLIEYQVPRLSLLEQRWVFAPLPTLTVFAKDALLKGLEPRGATEHGSLSSGVLPESETPTPKLAAARPGEWYIWRVMEPDETYHGYNRYDSLAIQVEAALRKVTATIAEIVEHVPEEVALRVILTTDHGRLLSKASRDIDVPPGMQSHGRAAWGDRLHTFDESGIVIEGDVAFLHGERFGLPANVGEVAIALGAQMFKTNDSKKGGEAFPHGGAYPEEVIVPWMVLERDWELPSIAVSLVGKAAAGKEGQAALRLINPADVSLRVAEVTLRMQSGTLETIPIDMSVKPRGQESQLITIGRWPTSAEIVGLNGIAVVELPTGRRFDMPLTLQLESEEMYRRDTLLEDLEL